MTCQRHPGNSTHTKPHRKHCVAVITIKNPYMEAFTTEQPKCRGYLLVMHSISKTGAFHKQFFLVSASSDRRAGFHSNQSGVLLAFFLPNLVRFNSSFLQDFTMTQNLWGKFSKVKGWTGAWFSLTTTGSWLLHVLLNISPNWLCKCLWKGGRRTGNPAGTCCSQFAHGAVRNFCSELPNILWISVSLQIKPSLPKCLQRSMYPFADLAEIMTSGKSHKKNTWLLFLPKARQLLAVWHQTRKSNIKCKTGKVNEGIFPISLCSPELHIVTCLGTPIWKVGK